MINTRRTKRVIALAVGLSLVAAACGGDDEAEGLFVFGERGLAASVGRVGSQNEIAVLLNGKPAAKLVSSDNGGTVVMSDAEGRLRAAMGIRPARAQTAGSEQIPSP